MLGVVFVLALTACRTPAALACDWTSWTRFKAQYLSEDGRVIDRGSARQHTVSEGQAYGLFFALVANDRESFNRLLRWTEDNLAQGDFNRHLPAWIWGRRDDGSWGVLDTNAASDADLWIAYTLAEAARLWDVRAYRVLAKVIARRLHADEVATLPGLGPTLLPAPVGFVEGPDRWRLNPSYVPLQLLRGLQQTQPELGWEGLVAGSARLITDSAPKGYSPDWAVYSAEAGFLPDEKTAARGSYDAIRTYLWVGMLHPQDPLRAPLLTHLQPMAAATAARGAPPEKIDTVSGDLENDGNPGFSASLLPFLAALGDDKALAKQRQRVHARAVENEADAYYEAVLTLFGRGWDEGWYRFTAEGRLLTRWEGGACSVLR